MGKKKDNKIYFLEQLLFSTVFKNIKIVYLKHDLFTS